MSNINSFYTQKGKKNKKKLIGIILFIITAISFGGMVMAYFSDSVQDNGEATTSTLDIESTYTVHINGTLTTLADLDGLNPGDVILISGNVSNVGNQSAWAREKIGFDTDNQTLLSFLRVYEGIYTQADFAETEPLNALTIQTGNFVSSSNKVINGTGSNAQIESGSDYNYVGTTNYDFAFTIYFMKEATNETQNETFGITLTMQALQFRNNNAAEPTEAAWAAVGA